MKAITKDDTDESSSSSEDEEEETKEDRKKKKTSSKKKTIIQQLQSTPATDEGVTSSSKKKKKSKSTDEPTTPFRRINDNIVVDPRLSNNSFEAKVRYEINDHLISFPPHNREEQRAHGVKRLTRILSTLKV